jgi:hypothetical protein
MADVRVCSHGRTSPCDDCQLLLMLNMRKQKDAGAPDPIVFGDDTASHFKRALKWEPDPSAPWLDESVVSTMVEAQRLADAVIDAAINWHKSDMEESMDAAQVLEDAIEALIEFRRKMPIVKNR